MPTSGETITLEVSNGVKVTYMIEAIGHSFESVTSYQYAPQTGGRKEEGGLLGGLGNLIDGDGY